MLSVQQLLDQKSKTLYSVRPGDPVIEAIRKMAEHHIGALLVMDGDRLASIVSERDYARKVVLMGRSSDETRVDEIMTPKVITVTARQDAHDCMRLMTDKRIRHLPVIDGGKLVGIISIGDLVKSIIADQKFIIEQLERYITG